ncbi:MAG: hypothetical protein ABIW82_12355 [Dokdonella sp.]
MIAAIGLALQKRLLEFLSARGAHGGLSGESIAMRTERVLRAQGQSQRYGSQFLFDHGAWIVRPTEHEVPVDERRHVMDMPSRADYACALRALCGQAPAHDAL